MRGTLTLLMITCLVAFVASKKQHKDDKHNGPYQNERGSRKVEHDKGSGGASTYWGSGVSGSGEGPKDASIASPYPNRSPYPSHYPSPHPSPYPSPSPYSSRAPLPHPSPYPNPYPPAYPVPYPGYPLPHPEEEDQRKEKFADEKTRDNKKKNQD